MTKSDLSGVMFCTTPIAYNLCLFSRKSGMISTALMRAHPRNGMFSNMFGHFGLWAARRECFQICAYKVLRGDLNSKLREISELHRKDVLVGYWGIGRICQRSATFVRKDPSMKACRQKRPQTERQDGA
ncbi:hypothetical protein [Ruegeria sp. HKCCA5763]|uniref:hypothetical protein n=1 Tax=Ruegeria sp. HKCCA5763 TaxID=2682987 RepID=UPI001487667C|nr:hypothetical protein [Ruegeria sp. HKCCA5763]